LFMSSIKDYTMNKAYGFVFIAIMIYRIYVLNMKTKHLIGKSVSATL
jgi:hypothetical protein